jgi:uncharacterized repeat protein (TIGR01451 family)
MVSIFYSRSLLTGLFLLVFSLTTLAQSGLVFRDFNSNGIADATADVGLPNIPVRAYRADGVLSGSAVSSATGQYTLSPAASAGEPVRVEFSLPTEYAGFYPSSYTTLTGGSGTSVQFVTGPATDVNYGINLPGDFCDTTPPLSVVCFVIGAGISVGENLVATIPANSTGLPASTGTGSGTVGHPNTPPGLVGSIWGTAWQPESGRLFSAAFVRRHTALGVGGTGGIYVTNDPRDPANSSSALFIDLNGLIVSTSTGGSTTINTGADPHMTEAYYQTIKQPNDPANRYFADLAHPGGNPADAIGKLGLGDMDLSNDQRYLYVVNPGQNHLYRITIDADNNPATNPTAADVLAYALPDPGCAGGTARPFGLGVRANKVFIGTICDAAQSLDYNDLKATIYKLDTDTEQFTTAITFSLNYGRGHVSGGEFPVPKGNWQPWNADLDWTNANGAVGQVFSLTDRPQVSSPQPMLTDIAFDDDGSLVAAFGDRFGHMSIFHGPDPMGNRIAGDVNNMLREFDGRAGGDILRICNVGSLIQPVYQIEQNGKCGLLGGGQFTEAIYGNDTNNNPIPGEFEFYVGDNYNKDSHTEVTMGSVAIVPGSGELIVSAFDPILESLQGIVYTNGFRVLSNKTGQYVRAFSLLNDIPQNNGNNYFGKASGLGGIEVLCLPKPLEIGNRVWLDSNGNGVQDAGEPPIEGVQLELLDSQNRTVGLATTNALGSYIFNQSNVLDAPAPNKTPKPGLRVSSDYTIRVAASQFSGVGAGVLANLELTSTTVNSGSGSAERDNNATLLGKQVGFAYRTGLSGESDHTLDIGFKAGRPQPDLSKIVSETRVALGSPLSYTVQVRNTGTASATALVVQDKLDAGLVFVSATPSSGTFVASQTGGTWTIPNLAPNQSATLIVRVIANQLGSLHNQATLDNKTVVVTTEVFCPTGACVPLTIQRIR